MENTFNIFSERKRTIFLIALFSIISAFLITANAQSGFGTLKGQVVDKETGKSLPFATVVIEINNNIIKGLVTDDFGNFSVSSLSPGEYDLKASYIGYSTVTIEGVIISANGIVLQDIELKPTVKIKEHIVYGYQTKLIDPGEKIGIKITSKKIQKAAVRDISSLVELTPGIIEGSIQGQRVDANAIYVDGVRVRGDYNVPMSSIQEIKTMTAGIPAEYGDLLGGVIIITTKNPLYTQKNY